MKSPALEHSSSAFKVCYRTSSPAACQSEVNPKSKQSLCKLFTYSSCLWFCYVHRFSKIFIYIFIGVCFPKHNKLFLYLSNSSTSRKFVVRPATAADQTSACSMHSQVNSAYRRKQKFSKLPFEYACVLKHQEVHVCIFRSRAYKI